jgi:tetratricopeptide (TPR) repeat protein
MSKQPHGSSARWLGARRPPAAILTPLGTDLPELQQARALWQLNRFDDALALFDKAVRKCPANCLALTDASRAFGARFEIARAEELLDRLIKLGGRNPQILHLAGQSYRMIFRPEKAMDCFARALAFTKKLPDAQLELALLYERRHRVAEAHALVEDCLRAEPGYHAAELVQARLLRRLGDETGAETILRRLAASDTVHPQIRAQASAEIAQLLDRHGQYDEAMRAMLRCKEILLRDEAPFRRESDVVLHHLTELAAAVTGDQYRRWAEVGAGLPHRKTAVLASFPRSGTTLLEQVLDSHSGLVSSDEREAFARDIFPALWQSASTPLPNADALDAIPPARLAAQRERYFAYMAAALNEPVRERVHLDKNPTLTLLLPAVLRLFPETRLLIALRDPRDVVLSCFMQFLPMNTNSVCFLTLERTARRYALDMGTWRQFRERIASPWLEVRYEDTVRSLEPEARRVLQFLDLPWEPAVMNYRDRLKDKAVSSPTYEAVSRPLYTSSIGRWKHYERYLEPHLPILQPNLEAFGYA